VAKWSPLVTVTDKLALGDETASLPAIPWGEFDPWMASSSIELCEKVYAFARTEFPRQPIHIVAMKSSDADAVVVPHFRYDSSYSFLADVPSGSVRSFRPCYWNGLSAMPIHTESSQTSGLIPVGTEYPPEIFFCTPCFAGSSRATISFTVQRETDFATYTRTYARSPFK
jgi:hypothetical protein